MRMRVFNRNIKPEFIDRMYRFAHTILMDEEEARDAVQDVLLKIYSKPIVFINEESYIVRSVRNNCLDRIRCRKEWCSLSDLGEMDEHPQSNEDKHLVRFAIAKLSYKQRMVIHLKDIEGYPNKEIAKLLGIEENQVRTILSRSRKAMKEIIEKELNHGR